MKADRLWCRSWRPLGVPRASNAQFCPVLRVFPTYLYADPFHYIFRHFLEMEICQQMVAVSTIFQIKLFKNNLNKLKKIHIIFIIYLLLLFYFIICIIIIFK